MSSITTRMSLNGVQGKYDYAIRRAVEEFVRRSLGSSDDYDVTVNINAKRVEPSIVFQPGDVYQYRFGGRGPWYTYVRGQRCWAGNMTDADMRNALKSGDARKCVVSPV